MPTPDAAPNTGDSARVPALPDGPPPLLRIRSGALRAAIPASGVQAVVRSPRAARVPGGTGAVPGAVTAVLNFRGEVVALADLGAVEGIAAVASATPLRGEWAVVLRTENDPLALAVDGVEDLLEAPVVGASGPVPGSGPFDRAPWLGVAKDGDGVLGVLDPEALANLLAPAVAAAGGGVAPEVTRE